MTILMTSLIFCCLHYYQSGIELIQLIQIMNEKKPIFIQIKEFYERLIDIGAYHEGDEMPSVREVALMNNANPNTVQRAFSLMVEDGYLVSIPKKGFYVQKVKSDPRASLRKELKELLNKGFTKEDILKELEEISHD